MTVTEIQPEVEREVTKRDVLHRAADLLEEFGWCQYRQAEDASGEFVSPQSSEATAFCVYGAVNRALFDFGLERRNSVAAAELLGDTPGTWESAWWNNAPDRTKGEVVAALRKAADEA